MTFIVRPIHTETNAKIAFDVCCIFFDTERSQNHPVPAFVYTRGRETHQDMELLGNGILDSESQSGFDY